MDDEQSKDPGHPGADTQVGHAGIIRQLFDISTFHEDGPGSGVRWLIRVILSVHGDVIGWFLWRLIDKDSVGNRSFVEEISSNAYIWACLIATALYGVRDRRARRQTRLGRLRP